MHPLSHSMVAAVAVVVHRRTGQDRVTIAIRDTAGPITVDVADDPAFETVTERVEAAVRDSDGSADTKPDVVLDLATDAALTSARLTSLPTDDDEGLRAEIVTALAAAKAAPGTVVSRLPLL